MRISIPAFGVCDSSSSFSFLKLNKGDPLGERVGEGLGDGIGDDFGVALGDGFGDDFGVALGDGFGDFVFFFSFVLALLEISCFANSSALILTSSSWSGLSVEAEVALVYVDLKGLKLISR